MYAIDKQHTVTPDEAVKPSDLKQLVKAYKLNAVRLADLADRVDADFDAQARTEADLITQQSRIMEDMSGFVPTSLDDVRVLLNIWTYEIEATYMAEDIPPHDRLILSISRYLGNVQEKA